MIRANQDIRDEAKRAGLLLWQIADALGVRDSAFSVLLRKELPDEKKAQIREVIGQMKDGEGNGAEPA